MTTTLELKQSEMLSAMNRAEIDIQIATAKQYPRDVNAALTNIKSLATQDADTAQECFYALRRGYGEDSSLIEGVSVRLAEIIASCWGNIRVATRIIGNDGRQITAEAICHDLQSNTATSITVNRNIVDRQGRTFSNDMQVVTGNAASAIAYRNAVLKVIPKALLRNVIREINDVAMGKAMETESSRGKMLKYFEKLGVSQQQICTYLGVDSVADIDKEMIFELRGLANAFKEGTATVQEVFTSTPGQSADTAGKIRREADKRHARISKAMDEALSKGQQPETVEYEDIPSKTEESKESEA